MLHIATAHLITPRWIEIQARQLRQTVSIPYRTWGSIQLIDASYGTYFDRVIDQKGPHAGKLNHLALEISQEAADGDLLMFLGSDAFPIADPMPTIEQALSQAPLVAVRRAENGDDPQPHQCFCVSTVGTWKRLAGDWSDGYAWPGRDGERVSDVGANLLRRLELTDTPWAQLLRSNPQGPDPLFFAVYGGIVYHHGAGPGAGELSRAHNTLAPRPLPAARLPGLNPVTRRVNRERRRWWERGIRRRQLRRSQVIYDAIRRGDSDWLAGLR